MAVGNHDKRRVEILVLSWLLVASGIVGASSVVGASRVVGADPESGTATPSVAGPSAATRPTSPASEAAPAVPTVETTTVETTTVETTTAETTTAESPRPLEPRFDFACEQVAVTARGYDSVTLVFEDGDRQTFRWSFRGWNVFFGTGENVGAVVAEVVVRRDGEQVTQRNPRFEACVARTGAVATAGTPLTATATTAPTVATATTPGTAPATATIATTVATATTPGNANTTTTANTTATVPSAATVTATPNTATPTANVTTVTTVTAATTGATATTAIATAATLDLTTFGDVTATPTTLAGTTVRGTASATTSIPTPTVTPRPIAGFPECSDEELGLSTALNLTYEEVTDVPSENVTEENGGGTDRGETDGSGTDGGKSFVSEDATEIEENRFRFTVEGESYELELVEVERNEADRPVSVAFDSELPMDAVIVRTGQGANVYEFPVNVSQRAALQAPTDVNTGQPFPIEEITFCYDAGTPTQTAHAGGPLDDVGLGFLAGRAATAAVGLAAAGLLVGRRRRGR
jgi:hypothetical protein